MDIDYLEFCSEAVCMMLKELGYNKLSTFVWTRGWVVCPDAEEQFGALSDDGYYELTKEGGGNLEWTDVYTNVPRIESRTYKNAWIDPADGIGHQCTAVTVYEAKCFLIEHGYIPEALYSTYQKEWTAGVTVIKDGTHYKILAGKFVKRYSNYKHALYEAVESAFYTYYDDLKSTSN